ncbi:twin-arginine translocase TatA/TatE family subunit [Oscillatoria sp. CS-180]|uniref:Sec-independent protein translocase subunit TatA/TatB n=1 Tax=Oscillatoria sp. CS-180 TaxID=3021720 RepID=UPI00233077C0|nr:twin-arginine translocase TatA/TatE family subunit [Oscillatoria sp. CS-180]MDB9527360.1 twin-arginine translocase TatA/TatE family subunit [Oscillatoria sp. CS-180]
MFNIGWTEVILVLGVGLLIFGPKKIPELGSALGKTLRGFREEMNNDAPEDETAYLEDEEDDDR